MTKLVESIRERLSTIFSLGVSVECTVSALNQLRVCADDFEVKATIGRGHFGEVTPFTT